MSSVDLSRPGVWSELFPQAHDRSKELEAEFDEFDVIAYRKPFRQCSTE